MMKRALPVALAVAAVVAAGIVHGFWTERWSLSADVAEGTARLERLPMKVGDWQGETLDLKASEQPGIAMHMFRRYVNQRTGDSVTIAIVCGRAGPVCIHTPDVCYGASGYNVGEKKSVQVPYGEGRESKFFVADAVKTKAAEKTALRIFWSWGGHGAWTVAGNPRDEFQGEPVLYKFYAIRDLNAPADPKSDPCVDFLKDFLPTLTRTLDGSGE